MSARTFRFLLAALLSLFIARVAFAHHGWTTYDEATEMSITGTITESRYVQPHATIKLEDAGESWIAWLAPLRRMETRGMNKEMVQVGETVTVVGYASTVKEGEMRAERIIIGDQSFELR